MSEKEYVVTMIQKHVVEKPIKAESPEEAVKKAYNLHNNGELEFAMKFGEMPDIEDFKAELVVKEE